MDKSEIITSVAGDLNATEQAVDQAIARATSLVQSMIGGRTALSLSPVTGAVAQTKAMEAIAALGVAREAIIATHTEMAKDHRRMGWGTYAIGQLDKYPEETKPGVSSEHRLRAV